MANGPTMPNAGQISDSDGAGGSIFTTVQGFTDKVMSSSGAGIVGYQYPADGTPVTSVEVVLEQLLSPEILGAGGQGDTDDTAFVQKWADEAATKSAKIVEFPGQYLVSAPITYNGSATKSIRGSGKLISNYTSEGAMWLWKNCINMSVDGRIDLTGNGSTSYTSRTNGFGFTFENCGSMSMGDSRCENLKYYGVAPVSTSNNNGIRFNYLLGAYCGTSAPGGATALSDSITGRSRSGSASSFDQRETLTMASLLPGAFVAGACNFVNIANQPYLVTGYDAGAKQITVYPWVDSTVPTPATLNYCIGGAAQMLGGDGNLWEFGVLNGYNSGCAGNFGSLYGAVCGEIISESCAYGFNLAANFNSAFLQGGATTSYFENNGFDIIKASSATMSFDFGTTGTLDPTKMWALAPKNGSDVRSAFYSQFFGVTGLINGQYFETHDRQNPQPGSYERAVVGGYANNDLYVLNPNTNAAYPQKIIDIYATGSGANNKPTGNITIRPTTGYSINSGSAGADYVIAGSSLTGGARILCLQNGTQWIVTVFQGTVV